MITLFITFFTIGLLAFGGGYAALPLIQYYVVERSHMLTMREMADIITISQMTPGPIAINAATFVGMKMNGVGGAIIATIGIVLPSSFILYILAKIKFDSNHYFPLFDDALVGIKPGIVGLILIASISMLKESVFQGLFSIQTVHYPALFSFVIGTVLYIKKVSIFKIIGISALLGMLLHFII